MKYILGIVSLAIGLLLVPSVAFAFPSHTNMWEFDEGGGRIIVDAIGYSNGELLGANTTRGPGKIKTGVHFTGAVGESALLKDLILDKAEGTVAFWFKLDALSDKNILVSSRVEQERNAFMNLGVDASGKLFVSYRLEGSTTPTTIRTTSAIRANEWHQLIFTLASSTYAFYVDGVKWTLDKPVHEGVWFSQISGYHPEYRLGASVAAGNGGVLRGTMDDLCFYNEGFTEEMAKKLHTGNAQYIQLFENYTGPKITLFTATPDRVGYRDSTELKWESTGAVGCLLFGTADATFPLSGTKRSATLTSDEVFVVSCWDSEGRTVKRSIGVLVGAFGKGIAPIKEDIAPLQEYVILPPAPPEPPEPEPEPEPAPLPPPPPAPVAIPTPPKLELPVGCSAYLHTYMKLGQKNDIADVRRLQVFLNETINAKLPTTGFFGPMTHAAVKRFQVKYHNEIIKPWLDAGYKASDITNGTGYVYKTTKYQINIMKCATLDVPRPDLKGDLN